MTIAFPDISSYEKGLTIQPGTVAVIAKATEGTYYRDAEYANFKTQAARIGAIFSAYHFLKAGNGAAQADYCHAMVGSTPVMLDVETEGTSKPTVADCLAFITRMRQLGGRVWGAYFPAWFWGLVGGQLSSLGVAVVSSNYTAYSDTGPGWAPYGGATPVIWQYTNAQSYGGQSVDFNAYRGTVQQLAALINGTTGGTDVALTSEDIAAVAAATAKAVYNYGEESVVINGKTLTNVPLGHLAHGAHVATNDPNGGLEQMRAQVNILFHRAAFDPAAFAAAVTPVIEQAVRDQLPADQIAAQIAAAVPGHLTLTVGAK